MDDPELSALLCPRLCHALVSPVGAVINGVEAMEDDAPEMRDHAVRLIGASAETAKIHADCILIRQYDGR